MPNARSSWPNGSLLFTLLEPYPSGSFVILYLAINREFLEMPPRTLALARNAIFVFLVMEIVPNHCLPIQHPLCRDHSPSNYNLGILGGEWRLVFRKLHDFYIFLSEAFTCTKGALVTSQ